MSRALQQTDLFGEPLDREQRRRRSNRRKQVAQQMARLQADHIMPMDVLAGLLRDAIEKGEREWMFKIAAELLPYTAPRLAAVVMAGSGLTAGNRLQVEWGSDYAGDIPSNPVTVLAPVVPEGDPPSA